MLIWGWRSAFESRKESTLKRWGLSSGRPGTNQADGQREDKMVGKHLASPGVFACGDELT